jgi:predicted O-methyltransferase YrrM
MYHFSNDWFNQTAKTIWDQIVPKLKPIKYLEIGSYEGASAVYMINYLSKTNAGRVVCVDTWEGGVEHSGINMLQVEKNFDLNVHHAIEQGSRHVLVEKVKDKSVNALSKLIATGGALSFDMIYIDGSHQAPDVLADAVLSYQLLRQGGLMVFDDYLWSENLQKGHDLVRSPKIAIDSFTNIYCKDLNIISAPLYQLYVQKRF